MAPRSPDAAPDERTTFSLICEDVLGHLAARYPDATWSVSRIDDGRQVHLYTRGEHFVHPGDQIDAEYSLCRRMLDGAPRFVRDATQDPVYRDVARPLGIHGYAAAPLLLGRREPVGGLCGFSRRPLDDGEVDQELLDLLARTISRALDLSRRNRALDTRLRVARDEALTDPLTGLLNRRGWEALLREAGRRAEALGDRFCVVLLDLDDLKGTNDRHGHAAGDDHLVRTARVLEGGVRQGDAVARIGGDEFVVLVETTTQRDDAEVVARLQGLLASVGVEASAGHAALGHGDRHDRVLARADRAMYLDKRSRRGPGRGDPGLEPDVDDAGSFRR